MCPISIIFFGPWPYVASIIVGLPGARCGFSSKPKDCISSSITSASVLTSSISTEPLGMDTYFSSSLSASIKSCSFQICLKIINLPACRAI